MKQIDISTPKFPNAFAIVDDEDFERLNQWKWRCWNRRGSFYAIRFHKQKFTSMHRFLFAGDSAHVDHRDGNGLNNQKSNLRHATKIQNSYNCRKLKSASSKFKGVAWHKQVRKWQALICVNGRNIYLGLFANEIDAAAAYNESALKNFGEFAWINKLEPKAIV